MCLMARNNLMGVQLVCNGGEQYVLDGLLQYAGWPASKV